MGLDMYLNGEKFLPTNWENPELNKTEDGFRLKEKILEIGYWRKHPNLHGYIVTKFADGDDNCRKIELNKKDLLDIIEAIRANLLPSTEGFFFGKSTGDEKEEDIEILQKAVKWLDEEDGSWRSVYYQASW
jgi:hypothetical protein